MLESLYAGSLEDAAKRQKRISLAELEKIALSRNAALDALSVFRAGSTVSVIAEIKRASPSKGALATIADPTALAKTYQALVRVQSVF